MKTLPIITDEQTLVSATHRFGLAIPVYDDGYGELYIHRDSMGISGIVRAQSWEDAYSICEDEFFPAADEEAFETPYEEMTGHEQACWGESYGYRGNSRTESDGSQSSVYAKDLNGDSLDLLTPAMLAELEISLVIESPVEEIPETKYFLWHESRRVNPSGRTVFAMAGRHGTYSSVSARKGRRPGAHRHVSPVWEDVA